MHKIRRIADILSAVAVRPQISLRCRYIQYRGHDDVVAEWCEDLTASGRHEIVRRLETVVQLAEEQNYGLLACIDCVPPVASLLPGGVHNCHVCSEVMDTLLHAAASVPAITQTIRGRPVCPCNLCCNAHRTLVILLMDTRTPYVMARYQESSSSTTFMHFCKCVAE